MSTVQINEQFDLTRIDMGSINGYLRNHCNLCGWHGQYHYNHNDYQHSNCSEERRNHKCINGFKTVEERRQAIKEHHYEEYSVGEL